MPRLYAEFGFGNATFRSTEIELTSGEVRIPGFFVGRYDRKPYVRIWVSYWQLSIDERGIKVRRKLRSAFKVLVGIASSPMVKEQA